MLPYLLAFCRIAIGLVFACAFLAKVRRAAGFAQTIANFDLLPRRWSKTAALLFLGGEVVVVILLILGGWLLPLAFSLASLVLFLFTVALISALRRNIKTSCNCFGASEKPISYLDVWRNVGFMACSLLGWWLAAQLPASTATENWFVLAWESLGRTGDGDGLLTLLAINAVLIWLVLLPAVFFLLLLGKRFRQLDGDSPLEAVLAETQARRGQPAPPFTALNSDEETVTLDSFKGKEVAFLFLSPSCKPCVEKIPALNDYYRQGTANGMAMIVINVDHHISPETFAQQHGVQLPILWAPQISNSFAQDYDAYSVVYVWVGVRHVLLPRDKGVQIMLKLRSMMEDVAEKLFGRFLPQVEAQANDCTWEFQRCCGPFNNNAESVEVCGGVYTGETICLGLCPQ